MKHAAILPLVRRLVDARPTYGYRRITALVNRQLAADGAPPANHKRDYLRLNPIPDAATALDQLAGWFEDYNESHRHSALRMRSPREFIRAQQPAEVSG